MIATILQLLSILYPLRGNIRGLIQRFPNKRRYITASTLLPWIPAGGNRAAGCRPLPHQHKKVPIFFWLSSRFPHTFTASQCSSTCYCAALLAFLSKKYAHMKLTQEKYPEHGGEVTTLDNCPKSKARPMSRERAWSLGEWLIALGGGWFFLALFFLPPITIVSGFLSENVRRLIWPAELAFSAAILDAGILLRRSASRKLSLADYVVVLVCTSILILVVFNLYGWVHLAR